MSVNKILNSIKEQIRELLPVTVIVSSIDIEGPEVVIYTKNLGEFARNNYIVRKLAQSLKKRVVIRPDPSELMTPQEAKGKIENMMPEEAEVTDIQFIEENGEVIIEAGAPGIAIGRKGALLARIKQTIGWAPKVVRTPPIHSKTVKEIRQFLQTVKNDRKKFLRKVGRQIYREPKKKLEWVRATCLGGFREVGRSCLLISTGGTKVLVDCGLNVGAQDDSFSPYLGLPEVLPLDSIDAVIVTHAHLDHSGLIPLLFKYGFDGPVYCTAPTRDLMSLLQLDYLKVAVGEGKKTPYDSGNIRKMVQNTITLNYGETTDISPEARLTFHNAGHILGSAIVHFHFGEGFHNMAVTGDIKFENTSLFNPASRKFPRLESMLIESTYGGKNDFQPPRKTAGRELKDIINRTIERGGKVLIPVFAVGRSQEVMITMEKLMRNGSIPTVPIYLDGMIMEATAIHTAYPDFLNDRLRQMIFQRKKNPFLSEMFEHVTTRDRREEICDDPDSCIVLATSGMLNGGPVMEYLKMWGSERTNTLVFVGYQAAGTSGHAIQQGKKEITFYEKAKPIRIVIKMNLEICDGFSGHSDRRQLLSYIATLEPRPEKILMGHGEVSKCIDFANTVKRKYGVETVVPSNLETIRLV